MTSTAQRWIHTRRQQRLDLRDLVVRSRAARTIPPPARWQLTSSATHDDDDANLWLLHVRYRIDHRAEDRDAIVERYTPIAAALARRTQRERESFEDLRQVALEGLLLALERFDPDRGVPFLGFAMPTIVGVLKRHFRDSGWAIRVPREIHDLVPTVVEARTELGQRLGRMPTRAEVAEEIGIGTNRLSEVELAARARNPRPLDDPLPRSGTARDIADEEDEVQRAETRIALKRALELLAPPDRQLVALYFDEGMPQATIAKTRRCSQMQVSRELRRVLNEMRSHLRMDEP